MTAIVESNIDHQEQATHELDGKLESLLQLMVSRIPADKKISASVVVQLLRSKYADTYSEEYITTHNEYIANTLEHLLNSRLAPSSTVHTNENKDNNVSNNDDDDDIENCNDKTNSESSSSESDEESYTDSNSQDNSENGEHDDDEDDEESDEDDEDESFDSSSDEEDESSEEEGNEKEDHLEPESKRAKTEQSSEAKKEEELTATETVKSDNNDGSKIHERCTGMITCLKKLNYRVRPRREGEVEQEYIDNVLVPEFVKHHLDPTRFAKSDIHRYKMKREVELLQQDGASLALDRRQRLGRGYGNVELQTSQGIEHTSTTGNGVNANDVNNSSHETVKPTQSTYTTSKFLDDAEEEEEEEEE